MGDEKEILDNAKGYDLGYADALKKFNKLIDELMDDNEMGNKILKHEEGLDAISVYNAMCELKEKFKQGASR